MGIPHRRESKRTAACDKKMLTQRQRRHEVFVNFDKRYCDMLGHELTIIVINVTAINGKITRWICFIIAEILIADNLLSEVSDRSFADGDGTCQSLF